MNQVSYVTVVSGVPRSGTSLMMRMLEHGGVSIVSDEQRTADEHNPHGYFEDQRVTRLARDAAWLNEASGKAVKVIYRLLLLQEIYDSQQAMLESRGDAAAAQDRDAIIAALARDLERVRQWMARQPNFRCLDLTYSELIADPAASMAEIVQFLKRPLDRAAMIAAVDPALLSAPPIIGRSSKPAGSSCSASSACPHR